MINCQDCIASCAYLRFALMLFNMTLKVNNDQLSKLHYAMFTTDTNILLNIIGTLFDSICLTPLTFLIPSSILLPWLLGS